MASAVITAEDLVKRNEQTIRIVAILLSASASMFGLYRALVPPCPPCRRCPRLR